MRLPLIVLSMSLAFTTPAYGWRGVVASNTELVDEINSGVQIVPPIPEVPPEDGPPPTAVNESKLKSLGVFKVYSYCPCKACCGRNAKGITATGTTATAGRTIATDPRIIPLGTEVVIDGHTYRAEDTGSGIRGQVIDLFCSSHKEALQNGIQRLEVFVYVSE